MDAIDETLRHALRAVRQDSRVRQVIAEAPAFARGATAAELRELVLQIAAYGYCLGLADGLSRSGEPEQVRH